MIFPYNSPYLQAVAYTTYFELGVPVALCVVSVNFVQVYICNCEYSWHIGSLVGKSVGSLPHRPPLDLFSVGECNERTQMLPQLLKSSFIKIQSLEVTQRSRVNFAFLFCTVPLLFISQKSVVSVCSLLFYFVNFNPLNIFARTQLVETRHVT